VRILGPDGAALYETSFRTAVRSDLPCNRVSAPALADFARRIFLKVGRKDGLCSLCRLGQAQLDRAEVTAGSREAKKARGQHRLHDWRPHLISPVVSDLALREGGATFTCRWLGNGDAPQDEAFAAAFDVATAADGRLRVRYRLEAPKKTDMKPTELGFAFVSDTAMRVDWDGLGPWTATPGKNLHTTPGLWRLNRDDINFNGNRAEVRWALASDGARGFFVIPSAAGDVSLEAVDGRVVLSCNVIVTGYGSKFGDGMNLKSVAGQTFEGVFEYGEADGLNLAPVVPDRPFSRHYGW